MRYYLTALLLGLLPALPALAAESPDGIWNDISQAAISPRGAIVTRPDRFRTVQLDDARLLAILDAAPSAAQVSGGVMVYLPSPDGGFEAFEIRQVSVMHEKLARRFPDIRTYAGQGVDDPSAWVRLDRTPLGFHAMWRSVHGTAYIDPYQVEEGRSAGSEYIAYYKHDYPRPEGFQCGVHAPGDGRTPQTFSPVIATDASSGPLLRTYRTAIAATAEYTAFHGGTVGGGLAAVVTALNRVTGIYETELAIRLELIANNDQLIFTNAATDGYTNNNGLTMLGQNQTKLDTVIGAANYDIGHVFSTGGGGIAGLGVVCRANNKARGVTGLGTPVGDPFYVDYVAHEMGHQYGANHTFNGTTGSCSGNRVASTAFEPGSGSTIMAYAGICGSQDIANNSDDHFHTASFDEISAYTTTGSGGNCDAQTATGNSAPSVDAGPAFAVPVSTPLLLTGSATDPDGQALVYRWEEFDLGPGGSPQTPSGNAPLFRSFPAVPDPVRMLPRLSDVLNNTQTQGELLPGYARNLHFRLTALDQQAGGGGVANDEVQHTVSDVAGPFLVTSQGSATDWSAGATETVTWDVANTTAPPVNCAAVDILFSDMASEAFAATTLAAGTLNDGSAAVTVPPQAGDVGRVMVKCSSNIFFDINDAPITIVAGAVDSDGDGVDDSVDNCTDIANPAQRDTDGDGHGNFCDADFNNDCLVNALDLGIFRPAFFSADPDADLDGSGVVNAVDLGIFKSLFFGTPGPSAAPSLCGA